MAVGMEVNVVRCVKGAAVNALAEKAPLIFSEATTNVIAASKTRRKSSDVVVTN